MSSGRPTQPFLKSGVIGLVLLAVTPFLFAAEQSSRQGARSPVEVESLSSGAASGSGPDASGTGSAAEGEASYRPPIEEDEGDGYSGFETQHQLQVLQQEVAQLRGLVEELSYQLQRMQSTQEDRYLELDGRLQDLQDQINEGGVASGQGASAAIADVPDEGDVVMGEGGEQELYNTALELIRNRQYDSAINQLNALIQQFPDGALTANAYYWLGEVHAAKPEPDYESARQALAQVISFFPDSRKVPDAAFKLGKVYHLMGDCERAEELLTQVINDHSGKSVAKLAENYLRDKVDCGG